LSVLDTLAERRTAIVVAGSTLFLDQLSKDIAATLLLGAAPVGFGPLGLRLAQNEGGALGAFDALPESLRLPLVVGLTLAVLLLVLPVLAAQVQRRGIRDTAVAFVLAGALGNLIDRLRHGHVIDFLTVSPELLPTAPVFNLADLALFTGALLLLVHRRRRRAAASGVAPPPLPSLSQPGGRLS
jgi:signal peptidase II